MVILRDVLKKHGNNEEIKCIVEEQSGALFSSMVELLKNMGIETIGFPPGLLEADDSTAAISLDTAVQRKRAVLGAEVTMSWATPASVSSERFRANAGPENWCVVNVNGAVAVQIGRAHV